MNLHKSLLVVKTGWLFTGDPTDKAAITLYWIKSTKVFTSSVAVEFKDEPITSCHIWIGMNSCCNFILKARLAFFA